MPSMPKNGENRVRQFHLEMPMPLQLVDDQDLNHFAELCEFASKLAQDSVRLNNWRKLSHDERGGGLSPERSAQLEIAEKILKKKIQFGKNGWYELPEEPKKD